MLELLIAFSLGSFWTMASGLLGYRMCQAARTGQPILGRKKASVKDQPHQEPRERLNVGRL